jgi:pimeloyl-ACP methyl ester carboxylesterase
MNAGEWLFLLAPLALGIILLWRYPATRLVRVRSLVFYIVVMSLLIWGALQAVAFVAMARVPLVEVLIVLWFTIAWRLAWALWTRTVGRAGQKWVRWARLRRRRGLAAPVAIRLIPAGRGLETAAVFLPAFLSVVLTHRCKLRDGTDPASNFQMPYEAIRIPTPDGLMLDGWFIPDDGAERTILICHGAGANKGNFIWFLSALAFQGYNVAFFDFRAHGASDGRTTSYGINERVDVRAAVDWLKRERAAAARVIVGLGSSQGAMALALAAAEDPRIDAVILDSPFTSARDLARGHARIVPLVGPVVVDGMLWLMSVQTGADFLHASAEQAVASMGPRPLLVIHGADDFLMPASHAQRLYNVAHGPRELWFGPGGHSNIMTADEVAYRGRVMGFLERHLGPVPRPDRRRRSGKADSPATESQPAGS